MLKSDIKSGTITKKKIRERKEGKRKARRILYPFFHCTYLYSRSFEWWLLYIKGIIRSIIRKT